MTDAVAIMQALENARVEVVSGGNETRPIRDSRPIFDHDRSAEGGKAAGLRDLLAEGARLRPTYEAAPGRGHGVDETVTGSTDQAATGITLTTSKKTETAGGGTDTTIKAVEVVDGGHAHAATLSGRSAVDGLHTHTVDVTQPSIALVFIMKV